jgi:hypothetical protein
MDPSSGQHRVGTQFVIIKISIIFVFCFHLSSLLCFCYLSLFLFFPFCASFLLSDLDFGVLGLIPKDDRVALVSLKL